MLRPAGCSKKSQEMRGCQRRPVEFPVFCGHIQLICTILQTIKIGENRHLKTTLLQRSYTELSSHCPPNWTPMSGEGTTLSCIKTSIRFPGSTPKRSVRSRASSPNCAQSQLFFCHFQSFKPGAPEPAVGLSPITFPGQPSKGVTSEHLHCRGLPG